MPNTPNGYNNLPITNVSHRKQNPTVAAALMIPMLLDERHEHGEDITKSANRINDQVKSGKRKGAMLLSDTHGIVVATGSGETDAWCTVQHTEQVQPV